jgi:hypothetical protein
MKTLKKNELLGHVTNFLKNKGIVLEEGSASTKLKTGCEAITGIINQGNRSIKNVQKEVTAGVDKVRQVIHESTAPTPAPAPKAKKKTTKSK